tara:strand:+ start:477 stop:1547 length:1071 start_codon:yes stop_codon:yes gene_type:complete
MKLNFIIHNKFSDELELLWKKILETSDHTFFQTFMINKIWSGKIGKNLKNSELKIITFFYGKKIIAIAPLILYKNPFQLNELVFLGHHLFDYLMIINDKENNNEHFKFIFHTIKNLNKVDIINFSNVPQFHQTGINHYKNYLNYYTKNNVYMSKLPVNKDQYFSKLKTSLRGDIRRQIRKLSNQGKISYNLIKKQDYFNFLKNLIYFKKLRYKKTNVKDTLNKDYIDFFYDLIKIYDTDYFHCSSLDVDDISISFHLGFRYQKKYYYYMPSFNQLGWGKFSPSRLHLLEIIYENIESNLDYVDFTIGDEGYKKYFTNTREFVYNFRHGPTLRGKFYIIIFQFLKNIKKYFTDLRSK